MLKKIRKRRKGIWKNLVWENLIVVAEKVNYLIAKIKDCSLNFMEKRKYFSMN